MRQDEDTVFTANQQDEDTFRDSRQVNGGDTSEESDDTLNVHKRFVPQDERVQTHEQEDDQDGDPLLRARRQEDDQDDQTLLRLRRQDDEESQDTSLRLRRQDGKHKRTLLRPQYDEESDEWEFYKSKHNQEIGSKRSVTRSTQNDDRKFNSNEQDDGERSSRKRSPQGDGPNRKLKSELQDEDERSKRQDGSEPFRFTDDEDTSDVLPKQKRSPQIEDPNIFILTKSLSHNAHTTHPNLNKFKRFAQTNEDGEDEIPFPLRYM